MRRFDMGAAFADAMLLLRTPRELVWLIAGLFVFLPTAVRQAFLPLPQLAEGEDFQAFSDRFSAYVADNWLALLLGALLTTVGSAVLYRLWLARSSATLGQTIGQAAAFAVPMFVASVLTGLISGVGALALIIPGLYLYGRLALSSAAMAGEGTFNPFVGLSRSMRLTQDNGWRVTAFVIVTSIVLFVAMTILSGLSGALAGLISAEPGRFLATLFDAAWQTIMTVVGVALLAATYRQLRAGEDAALAANDAPTPLPPA